MERIAIEKEKEKLKDKIRIERKFNELVNHLTIKLIKRSKRLFSVLKNLSTIEKNLKIEPIDLSPQNKCIDYCDELPLGKLSSCYINIETMNVISFDVEISESFTFY